MPGVELLQPPPWRLEDACKTIFTEDALLFLQKMCKHFDEAVESLYTERARRAVAVRAGRMPTFRRSRERSDPSWTIDPLPTRVTCRRVDLGDVSASNTAHLVEALGSAAQGVQVDFDDGHCPTWRNQVQAYYNVYAATRGELAGAPATLAACPVLMLRPRAWNMIDHYMLVDGKEPPGALADFALLMFHNARALHAAHSGPFLYLSKLESAEEARLWDDVFVWTQAELGLPLGTIKACVLIENILSSFELDEILYALRRHSLGLNCGIWDYAASVCAKFGWQRSFMLPERGRYVKLSAHFLASYLRLVVRAAHARRAPATGGMAAALLAPHAGAQQNKEIIARVLQDKLAEIQVGVDGFLVYDARLVPHLNELWQKYTSCPNQLSAPPPAAPSAADLLAVPRGGVSLGGVRHNLAVAILFVYHWLAGVGHFFYEGAVEDSATAEISRWQLWQWIRFEAELEESSERVTAALVSRLAAEFSARAHRSLCRSAAERKRLSAAQHLALELLCLRRPPEFLTSHLNDSHKFRTLHNKALLSAKSSL